MMAQCSYGSVWIVVAVWTGMAGADEVAGDVVGCSLIWMVVREV